MHDDHGLTEARLKRVLDERIRPAVYPRSVPLATTVWTAPGEPVSVREGLAAESVPIETGDHWGPPWGTSWFTVTGTVPAEWQGESVEALLDLGFDENMPGFQCEGLVYRSDGSPVKGINPRNQWVRVADRAEGGEEVRLHIEAASNPVILDYHPFLPTRLGDKSTAGDEPQYKLTRMDLAVFDETVHDLALDLEVLAELLPQLPADSQRRHTILRAVARALDAVDLQDVNATAARARSRLSGVLTTPAEPSAHRIGAIGHAHIDSAWLWPLRETVRKVARTAANMTSLLEQEPDFVFTMSQAQQFAWLKEHRPEVYERVKAAVADGRFVPTGGMWVESDTNMPGSEAMARQFVHGKRFFIEEFGIDSDEVWLPDTFGFAAGLPQIIKAAGSRWLLTQKISWSAVNTFPHHTFDWEGIDGTRIFTHFPPVDTYNCSMKGSEISHAAKNFKDKGRATCSLAPTGWGDGGGGTTREMVGKAARLRDLEGSPTVRWQRPADFFTEAHAENPDPPVWVGELYLELHRGTFTSQSGTKRGNRRCEHLLYEAELWSATAAVRCPGFLYPHERLDRLWKTVLLHQFHDILPGSSIAWVHREAELTYATVAAQLEKMIDRAQHALAGAGDEPVTFNATPHTRDGVAAGGASRADSAAPVRRTPGRDGGYLLDNGLLRVVIDGNGLVTSVHDIVGDRETIAPGQAANLLQIHPDFPNMWDAWDVDPFYRNTVTDLVDADDVTEGEGASVRVLRSFGASTCTQVLSLAPGENRLDIDTEVDWHETEKFLKLGFPLDVRAQQYASETQFGHFYRPTHVNTSWDAAKFEACNHRFLHVEEPGWGVALVNDATYGHDVTRTVRDDGGTTTTVRASLLRAPRFPDPETDQGVHRFRHALVPGAGIGDAVRQGWRANVPARTVRGSGQDVEPLFRVDSDAVVITAVKLADDGSSDVVVRFHEAHGGRVRATLRTGFATRDAAETDLLERPVRPAHCVQGAIQVDLRPFELRTIRFRQAGPS